MSRPWLGVGSLGSLSLEPSAALQACRFVHEGLALVNPWLDTASKWQRHSVDQLAPAEPQVDNDRLAEPTLKFVPERSLLGGALLRAAVRPRQALEGPGLG